MAEVAIVVDGDLSSVGEVKNVGTIQKIEEIGRLSAFPEFRQPYNKMLSEKIPAIKRKYEIEYETPDCEVEILAFTVTCSGYGEDDYFDMYINDRKIFDTWYLTEVKEGLYLGTSTFAYRCAPNTKLKVDFYNNSGSSKTAWFGIRMLVPDDTEI